MKVKKYSVNPAALAIVACIALLSLRAVAQEVRSEVSVQETGFFTKGSNGNGIKDTATETGVLLIGYRHNIGGSRRRPTTAMTATHRATSEARQAVCSRTFTKSPAKQW